MVRHSTSTVISATNAVPRASQQAAKMETKSFRDFDLQGSIKEPTLQSQCQKLYNDILSNCVDEDLFEDFCDSLSRKVFVDAVKGHFPVLCGQHDEPLSTASTAYMETIRKAAARHNQETLPPLSLDDQLILMARFLLTTLSDLARRKQGIEESHRIIIVNAYAAVSAAVAGADLGYTEECLQGHAGPIEVTHQIELLENQQRKVEKGRKDTRMLAAIRGAKNMDLGPLFEQLSQLEPERVVEMARRNPEALRRIAEMGLWSFPLEGVARELQTGAKPTPSYGTGTDHAKSNDPSSQIEHPQTKNQHEMDRPSYLIHMHEAMGFEYISPMSRELVKASQTSMGLSAKPQDHTQKQDDRGSTDCPGGSPREDNVGKGRMTSTVHLTDSDSSSRGSRTKGHGSGDGQSARHRASTGRARSSTVGLANPVMIRTGSPHEFVREAPPDTQVESAECTYLLAPSVPTGRKPHDILSKSPTQATIAEQEPGASASSLRLVEGTWRALVLEYQRSTDGQHRDHSERTTGLSLDVPAAPRAATVRFNVTNINQMPDSQQQSENWTKRLKKMAPKIRDLVRVFEPGHHVGRSGVTPGAQSKKLTKGLSGLFKKGEKGGAEPS